MTRDLVQEQIDAAWAAHEGDRDPGISDLEWQQHSTRWVLTELKAGPLASARRDDYEFEEAAA